MKQQLLKFALLTLAALPMGAWAEDATSTTATWLFSQFYNSTLFTNTTSSTEIKYNFNGMYFALQKNANRTLVAASESMPNATAPSINEVTPFAKGTYVGLTYNAKSSTFGNNAADKADANSQMAAMKFTTAGKLYALVKPSYKEGETRRVQIYEGASGEVKSTCTSTSAGDWFLLSCDVTSGNRYFIGSPDASWTIYAVKFVPTSDATNRSDNNISVNVSGGYATFSSACNYSVPANYKAYVVSSIGENKATLTQITHIPSNTGVILVGDDKNTEVITMQNIRESDITSGDRTVAASNSLIANVGTYALPASSGSYYNYTLAAGPIFKHSNGSGDLAANKAYLRTTVDAPNESRGFDLSFGDEDVTGVSSLTPSPSPKGEGSYYNLAGQRVAQPTKGLYIVNGKKVIIK